MIAGAPKCGTTALYQYLQTHPQIFLTEPKEPHFFAEDLGAYRTILRWDDYVRLFRGVGPEHKAIGEASVWSMHSADALERIKAKLPDIRLIIMLRNPADFIRSLHSDLVWICFDDQPDLELAWAASAHRRSGQGVPRLCQVPWFLDYAQLGRFSDYVQRLLQVFPREQVKFLLFDDLVASPQAVYEETLAFLGLESDGRSDFARVNPARQNRWNWLAKCRAAMIRSLPRPAVDFGKKLGLGHVSNAVLQLNSRPAAVKPLRPEFRQELLAEFHGDVVRLSDLIGRNLDSWQK